MKTVYFKLNLEVITQNSDQLLLVLICCAFYSTTRKKLVLLSPTQRPNKLFSALLRNKVQVCGSRPGVEFKWVANGEGWLKGIMQILRGIWSGWEATVKSKDVHGSESRHWVSEDTKPPLGPLSIAQGLPGLSLDPLFLRLQDTHEDPCIQKKQRITPMGNGEQLFRCSAKTPDVWSFQQKWKEFCLGTHSAYVLDSAE